MIVCKRQLFFFLQQWMLTRCTGQLITMCNKINIEIGMVNLLYLSGDIVCVKAQQSEVHD